ncbi:ribokinase [Rhodospirillum rubrum]|uniref:ribokinase n=1 Tax=Rhodospirillum rubrum TaxID=1085 RepID=UPI0019064439|nr:ribokinase [Rhodospirillum rubrum]MBK1664309.1 ribokinase [Rhodospirillum rubrum]MBK1677385.1 ribokinase [Rhodospirillum rubrum]
MSIVVLGSYAKALVMTAARIPTVGETLLGWDYRETYGGKGSDMAVQAARLGQRVGYVGVVGDDAFGHDFVALMTAEGVGIEGLRLTREKPTGVGFIVKDTQARNIIIVDRGANALFDAGDIDAAEAVINDSSVVLAQLEIPVETALYGLRKAKALGRTTILNPAPAIDLRGHDLSAIDVLTPNESEARIAAGLPVDGQATNAEAAAALLATGCKAVVMTLGEQGAAVFTAEDTILVPPHPVAVVDSNGAGDSFNAALAVALAEGRGLRAAARFAGVVASLCCTRWETVPSYHTRAEVEAVLAKTAAKQEICP